VDRLRRLYRSLGAYFQIGLTYVFMGDIERAVKNLDAAEQHYGEAARIYKNTRSPHLVTALADLALIDLARGKWEASRERLESAMALALRLGQPSVQFHAFLLAPAAALRRWSEFDYHLSHAGGLVDPIRLVHPDLADTLELAGRLALQQKDGARAAAAFSLARSQWIVLSDEARAGEMADLVVRAQDPEAPTISLY
jgi:tetratricopeptide (TPR) repeat protein